MEHIEKNYTSHDGIKIFYQVWRPDNQPKAVIQIIHGFAEHSSRYMNVVNTLVPEGYAIYIADLRGHGRSEGERAYVPNSFNDFVIDHERLSEIIRTTEQNVPLFLLGHSLGSYIAILYSANTPELFQGLILSGSGTAMGGTVNPITKFFAKLIARFFPKGKIEVGVADHISRDLEVVNAYKNDPSIFTTSTFKLGSEILKITPIIPKDLSKIKIPILMQSGEFDTAVLGARELSEYITTSDKTIKIYKDCFHEVYNELEESRTLALKDLLNWLNKRL